MSLSHKSEDQTSDTDRSKLPLADDRPDVFIFKQKVLFKHCDPAGIVFYPRYFEMMNDCVEAFFDKVVGTPFETMHQTGGVPTAEIQTKFTAPSRHGDHLQIGLQITHVGQSSVQYLMRTLCAQELRFETRATLVQINSDGRPTAWSDAMRSEFMKCKDQTP